MQGKIKIGPVGNRDPKTATMVGWDEGSHNGLLSQIFISHGGAKGIFSIQFQFMLDDDKFVLSDQHGSNFGDKFDVITLNCPHEYITGISGEYSTYIHGGKSPHICSLKVATNTSEYGPFGSLTDYHQKFEFKLGKYSQFGGFHGTYDVWGLHHIGVYLQPTNVRPKSKPKTGTNNAKETESTIVLG